VESLETPSSPHVPLDTPSSAHVPDDGAAWEEPRAASLPDRSPRRSRWRAWLAVALALLLLRNPFSVALAPPLSPPLSPPARARAGPGGACRHGRCKFPADRRHRPPARGDGPAAGSAGRDGGRPASDRRGSGPDRPAVAAAPPPQRARA